MSGKGSTAVKVARPHLIPNTVSNFAPLTVAIFYQIFGDPATFSLVIFENPII